MALTLRCLEACKVYIPISRFVPSTIRTKSYVKHLDKNNFYKFIKEAPHLHPVNFHDKGEASREFAPKFEAAAYELVCCNSTATLGEIDVSDPQNKEIKDRYHITVFPTLYRFGRDIENPTKYFGPLQTDDVVKFIKEGPTTMDDLTNDKPVPPRDDEST